MTSIFLPAFRRTEASRFSRGVAMAILLLGFSPLAKADFRLYQNFENLPVGYNIADSSNANENFSVAEQEIGNPAARYGDYTVILDPTNPGNQLLKLDAVGYAFTGQIVDAATGTPMPIVNLTTGTLFYRIYRVSVNNTPDVNFGGADLGTLTNNVNNAANYQSQLNVSGGTDIFRPRNGGSTVDTGVNWTAGTWFGIYQVIDTASNSTLFFYQGEADAEPIPLGGMSMAFRNGGGTRGTTDIGYFLAVNGLPGGGVNDIYYLDDIYYDTTDVNLDAPVPIASVPEPSTYGLLLLAFVCGSFAVIRRRRAVH